MTDREKLKRVEKELSGIDEEDLTKAEKNILKIVQEPKSKQSLITAYKAGRDAYSNGYDITDNIYRDSTSSCGEWEKGWKDAAEGRKGKDE